MINLEKLDAAIAYIEANPTEWKQDTWFYRGDGGCGTAACLAGTIAILDGWTPTDWQVCGGGYDSAAAEKGGTVRVVGAVAREILGIGPEHVNDDGDELGEVLFAPYNTVDDIKQIRDEIAEGQHG